jgi:hypothetical protein
MRREVWEDRIFRGREVECEDGCFGDVGVKRKKAGFVGGCVEAWVICLSSERIPVEDL